MRYENRELMERLAGEYVLGSLTGGARRRFEQLMRNDPKLEALVIQWQEELTPLADQTPEISPPPQLLGKLKRHIGPGSEPTRPGFWNRLATWRQLALANGALAGILALFLGLPLVTPTDPEMSQLLYVGVLEDRQQQSSVVVLAYNKPWRLEIESKVPLDSDNDSELRLWIESDDQTAPQFLATIPSDTKQIALSESTWDQLKEARFLLVSRDPAASPTTRPVGAVLFRGLCINLKKWSSKPMG